MAISDDGTLR